MPYYDLRPNATHSSSGFNYVGGATTVHGALGDGTVTTGIQPATAAVRYAITECTNLPALAGNEFITVIQSFVLAGSYTGTVTATTALPQYVGIQNTVPQTSWGNKAPAKFFSRYDASRIWIYTQIDRNFGGGLWTPTTVNALRHVLRTADVKAYYWGMIRVHTILTGTATVSGPSGTVTSRKGPITWTYSPGLARQTRAQVRIFTAAQYGAGGFDPWVTAPYRVATLAGTAGSWTLPQASVLPDGAYRAYVTVEDSGVKWVNSGNFAAFTVSDPPNTPTSVSPVQDEVVPTAQPTLSATLINQVGGARTRAEFQVASEDTFATDLQTFTQDVSLLAIGTRGVTVTPTFAQKLFQGPWSWRVRSIDEFGTNSSWSATKTFVVAHPPVITQPQPTSGKFIPYGVPGANQIKLEWAFTDPYSLDLQTAFQVRAWAASDPETLIVDTGEILSADKFYVATITTAEKDVDLYWEVQVRDVDEVWGPWSSSHLFRTGSVPTVVITSPADGGTATSPSPVITFTFTGFGGRTLESYTVFVEEWDGAQYVPKFLSPLDVSGVTSYTLPSIIDLTKVYRLTVTATDSEGLVGVGVSEFDVSYNLPEPPTITVSGEATFDDNPVITVDWTATPADATFVDWRVYRRPVGTLEWELAGTFSATERIYEDWLAPSNTPFEYAVSHRATRFSLTVESLYTTVAVNPINHHYWLICLDEVALNTKLYNVTADAFQDEIETAEIKILGRGRRLERGTHFGVTGELMAAFNEHPEMSARAQRLAVQDLRDSDRIVYLRNPFGDIWLVSLSSMRIERIAGVGLNEHARMTIGYAEITG